MSRKRTFVNHVVPKKMIEKLPVSQAGNYFSYNLINGDLFDNIFSLVPTNIVEIINEEEENIIFIQSRKFKHSGIYKMFNIIRENITLFRKIQRNNDVWFYNLSFHSIISFFLIFFFKRNVNVFVIVLDYTPSKSIFSIEKLILLSINSFAKGIVTLKDTPDLRNKNKLTIPGVVDELKGKRMVDVNNKFLLSGILSANRNPELILEVFSQFPTFELIITGVVDDMELLNKYLKKYDNIKFLGLLEYDLYEEILDSATYCLNSRDPSYEENNFNFPSKIIEHLLYNKIIISTMKYSELSGIKYFFVEPTKDSLTQFLMELPLYSQNMLLSEYANQSNIVLNKFGIKKWSESLKIIESFNLN